MNSRRVARHLRSKTAIVVVIALAGATALTVPNLAGALTSPSISSPSDNAVMASGDRTVAFSMPSDDFTETSYTLLRGGTHAGACDTTARGAAAPAGGTGGTELAAPPTAPGPLTDNDTISDGAYCYWIQADDSVHSGTTFSAPVKVTIDTTPPPVSIGSTPGANSNDATPSFSFSSTDGSATFECSIDGASYAACTSPATLTTLADGPHTFAVKAIDAAGNHSTTAASYGWAVDTTPPPVAIDSQPASPSNDSTPPFAFSSSDGSATFECSIDGGGYSACSSPKTLGSLSDASHTFAVKAIDPAGNHTVTAASYTWTVDTARPTATIGTKPSSLSNTSTPDFSFSSSEPTGATFECSIDGASLTPCTTPYTLPTLSDTSHTFAVKAIDLAGNHSTTAASYSWTVDTTPPSVTIGTQPPSLSNDSTPTFGFSSGDGSATFECSLDGASYAACAPPKTFTTVADGPHTFAVKAIDLAGNHTATAASYTWTIDATPPTASILTNPSATSNDRNPGFTFGSSEPTGATFECSLDGAGYTACTTPKALSSLIDGSHTFNVKAIDLAANHSTSAATYTWSVDGTAPTVPGSFQIVGAGTTRNAPPTFKFTQSSDAHTISYSLLRDGADTGSAATLAGGFESMTDSNIIGDGTDDGVYHYTVRATDSYGNHSTTAEIVVTIDGGPPSVPANVHAAAALTRSAPVIAWNAATGQPATYRVFRDGVSIGTATAPATTFSDATLPLDGSADRTYTYTVSAIDSAGNASAASLGAQVVLDTLGPSPSSAVMVAQSPTRAKPVLVWPASASTDVAGYNVYRGGAKLNGALVTTSTFTDSGLDADGSYAYTVRAVDNAGNESADSRAASVLYDTTAPGTPGGSAVAAPSGGTATVSWSAASDAGAGVAAYQVRRSAANGGPPASLSEGTPICGIVPPNSRGCADAGLAQGASYRYSVFAVDAVGNVSLPGQTATISIPSTADTTPPKTPTALHAVLANGRITLTWKNPKSDLARVLVVWNAKRAPRSSTDGNPIYRGTGTKVTLKLPSLKAGKQVRFAVFAADKSGNVSVAARATINVPRPSPVSLPENGKLAGSPALTWNPVTGATYYNVQVFEGTQAAKRVGIAWPAVTKYKLPGKDMKKGKTYTWYVWPGIGAKSAAKYGKLIGKVTFKYAG